MRGLVWRQEAAHHIVLVPFFSSMFLILHLTPNHVLTCRQEELGIKSPILRPDLPSKPQPRPADPWCQNWAEKFSLIQPVVTKTAYPIRALVPCVLFQILHKCDWSIWLKLQAESHKKIHKTITCWYPPWGCLVHVFLPASLLNLKSKSLYILKKKESPGLVKCILMKRK